MMERADLDLWRAKEVARLLALVETERRYYQAIVATVPVGLLVVTNDLRIASTNRSFRLTMGLRTDEVLRQRLTDVLPAEGLSERVIDVLSSGVPQFRALFELDQERGGRLVRVSITALPSWDDEFEREALLLIEDLSDFVQRGVPPPETVREIPPEPAPAPAPPPPPAEAFVSPAPATPPAPVPGPSAEPAEPSENLREKEEIELLSNKMEALARLAAGLAHDYNNLVMIIQGYAEELLENLPAGSTSRDDMEQILRAAERLEDRNAQLTEFSRREAEAAFPLDMNSAIVAAEPLMRRGLPADVSLVPGLGRGVGKVPLTAHRAETLLTGIACSAAPLMSSGGVFRVETGRAALPDDWPAASHLPAGDYVKLSLLFPGELAGEDRRRLFEPYEPGKEERLGMFFAYGIAKQAGGDIRLISGEGTGTAIHVYLPEIEKAAPEVPKPPAPAPAPAPPPAPVEPPPPARATVLLVEDESGIRALMRKILTRQGYRVLEADSGTEALRVAAQHGEGIDLLVTDLVMPECGGRQLAERMSAVRPDLRVLYVSGYTDDPAIRSGNLPAGTGYLQKPFTLGTLVQRVEELLAATPPAGG